MKPLQHGEGSCWSWGGVVCVWPTFTSSTLQGVLPFLVGLTVQTKDAEVFRLLGSRDQALDSFLQNTNNYTHRYRGNQKHSVTVMGCSMIEDFSFLVYRLNSFLVVRNKDYKHKVNTF